MRERTGMTRRSFLGSSAVAFGAPCIVAAATLGAERAAPSDRLTVGIIGMGKQCGWHLGNIAYRLKRPLKWDPAREVFLGDDEANRQLDRPKRQPWTL